MPLPKTLRREIEVAFSKHAQPVWFRILKYTILGLLIYFFGGYIAMDHPGMCAAVGYTLTFMVQA